MYFTFNYDYACVFVWECMHVSAHGVRRTSQAPAAGVTSSCGKPDRALGKELCPLRVLETFLKGDSVLQPHDLNV